LASSAEPFLEASFCETLSLGRRVILQCPICEASENGVLLATDTLGTSCTDLTNKKTAQKVNRGLR